MQKDPLDRTIVKESYSGSPKGNKRKNLRKDKKESGTEDFQ